MALKLLHIVPSDDPYVLVLAGLFLAATVFAAVHHVEVLALRLGELLARSFSRSRLSLGLLVLSLAAVVLLAKTLSYPVVVAIGAAGLPKAFVGLVIALIVLMPEGLAAIKSALRSAVVRIGRRRPSFK